MCGSVTYLKGVGMSGGICSDRSDFNCLSVELIMSHDSCLRGLWNEEIKHFFGISLILESIALTLLMNEISSLIV